MIKLAQIDIRNNYTKIEKTKTSTKLENNQKVQQDVIK